MSKASVLIFLALVFCIKAWDFDAYIERFGKIYADQDEYNFRQQIYATRCAEYDQINSENRGYTVGETRFTDRTNQQIAEATHIGVLASSASSSSVSVSLTRVGAVTTLPTSVDWRNEGAVTTPRDQGSCGSCWAFGTVGIYQSILMIGEQGQYDLSQQYILECTSQNSDANYPSTCAGGYVDFSIPFAVDTGIPLETDYPYLGSNFGSTASTPTTTGICTPTSTIKDNTVNGTHRRFDNLTDDQMKELVTYAPVLVLIYADSGFMSYTSGVYSGCPDYDTSVSSINHAVIVIGYDQDGNWIVKNSWGTGWGENGYATVSKDSNCAITYQAHEIRGNNQPLEGFEAKMLLNLCIVLALALMMFY